jgi:hypothetical protein
MGETKLSGSLTPLWLKKYLNVGAATISMTSLRPYGSAIASGWL